MNLYSNKELIIDPVYQRFFRWDKNQKTSFIESILLWMPTPSIFVYERKDGIWELIDWLQRLSTILEFFGLLKTKNLPKASKKSLSKWLLEWKYIKSLSWITIANLPKDISLKIKRHKITVSVIKKESDEDAKLEIFRRLNTWGSFLSNQEIRNAILVQENKAFYDFLHLLRENIDFIDTVSPSEKDTETEQDTEMVLRYLCVKNKLDESKIRNVRIFLDTKMMDLYSSDYAREKEIFEKTFNFLNQALSSDTFKRPKDWRHSWRVVSPAFDVIAGGIWYNLEKWNINLTKDFNNLTTKIRDLWFNDTFNKRTEVWKSSESKMSFAVEFGKAYFNLKK